MRWKKNPKPQKWDKMTPSPKGELGFERIWNVD